MSWVRVVLAVIYLAVFLFCVFGFVASFEPPGSPGVRVIYGCVGIASFITMVGIIRQSLWKPRRPSSLEETGD
jgi:hypothetical protein